ncbi:MAG: GDSL-type esterase/lipase family protein [Woeseia sp.]
MALLFISLVIAGIAAEVLLRAIAPQNFDIHPRGLYTADASVGYVLSPGVTGTLERSEFSHDVSIGPAGLRGPDPRPRQPNTFRVVCLGDSFTWGFGVGDDEAFPSVLERRLANRYPAIDAQVVNAGVPGYGTYDELRFLQSRLDLLDPDLLVLTFLAENDFVESRDPALGRVRVEDGWLRSPVPPREEPWQTLDWIKNHSHAARLLSERAGYLATRSGLLSVERIAPRVSPEDEELALRLLGEIARLAGTRGAATVFMFTSSQAPVIAEAAAEIAGSNIVARAAREAGAGHIDLPAVFRMREDRFELYYQRDGHWTAAGHSAAAEALYDYIDARFSSKIEGRATVAKAPEGN